jgi:cysteine sulfinate desulfinase/cysteine desulfurase-like protein
MSIFLSNKYAKLISQKIVNEIDKWEQIINNNKNINFENIISKYKAYIFNFLSISPNKYEIYITNGYRSYNLIFKILNALCSKGVVHVIISNTEENVILSHCKQLIANKILDITFIDPNKYGIFELDIIKHHIKKNTKLISMPYINKDLGTINNLKEITELCKSKSILFASNINNLFGYSNNYKILSSIDISFISFESIYGPSNLSLLIIKKNIVNDNITKLINSSSYSISEKKSIPLISGSLSSIISTTKNRNDKNEKIQQIKNLFINKLNEIFPTYSYSEFNNIYRPSIIKLSIVFINDNSKSNSVLFSVYSNKVRISSNNIKKYIENNDIYINDIPNHIFNIINYNSKVKNGILSITFGDNNKQTDINKLLKCLLEAIKIQYVDLYNEIKDNIVVKQKLNQKKIKKVVRFSSPIQIGANSKKHNHPKLKSILV